MKATAIKEKESLIARLAEVRGKILETAGSLAPSQQDEVFLGTWSVKDLLAHLIGWDYANLEAAKAILDGRLPAFYAYHDKDWQSYNSRLVARYKQENFDEMLAAVHESQEKLIHFLQNIPAEEFNKERGIRFRGYKVTIARLLQAEMDDEKVHLSQVEALSEDHTGIGERYRPGHHVSRPPPSPRPH